MHRIWIGLAAVFVLFISCELASAKGRFDGKWVVDVDVNILASNGFCIEPPVHYIVTIDRDGTRVRFDPATAHKTGANIRGNVDSSGFVSVTVKRGGDHATGEGQISGDTGSGTWSSEQCEGKWQAERD